MEKLNNKFKIARLQRGLSIQEASSQSGIAFKTLWEIENEVDKGFNIKIIKKLCDFYNIPLEKGIEQFK